MKKEYNFLQVRFWVVGGEWDGGRRSVLWSSLECGFSIMPHLFLLFSLHFSFFLHLSLHLSLLFHFSLSFHLPPYICPLRLPWSRLSPLNNTSSCRPRSGNQFDNSTTELNLFKFVQQPNTYHRDTELGQNLVSLIVYNKPESVLR